MSSIEQVQKTEQQQIQSQIEKNNLPLPKQDNVIQEQKTFCHFCPTRIEMNTKESFYKFPNGKVVFFCNNQEKETWLNQINKNKLNH